MPKTAIVTGSTRGIGRATAVALGRLGYHVVVTGPREEEEAEPGCLAAAAAAVDEAGGHGIPIFFDLVDRAAMTATAEEAMAALGHVDVLHNNALYGKASKLRYLESSQDDIENRIYGILTAYLVFSQPIIRHMVERGEGLVTNMVSGAGQRAVTAPIGEGGWSLTYGVAKAGLIRWTAQLLAEIPTLRMLSISPGAVATEKMLASSDAAHLIARSNPVEVVGEVIARIIDAPTGTFPNGSMVEVPATGRLWGLIPPEGAPRLQPTP
jgi:NAD(P)-dependent dehydrogenase (short-subunit alcohol dehydrogenase family)